MVNTCHSCSNCRKYNLFTVRTSEFFQCSCLNIFNLWPRPWGSNLPPDLLGKVMILGHQSTVKKKKKKINLYQMNAILVPFSDQTQRNRTMATWRLKQENPTTFMKLKYLKRWRHSDCITWIWKNWKCQLENNDTEESFSVYYRVQVEVKLVKTGGLPTKSLSGKKEQQIVFRTSSHSPHSLSLTEYQL